MALVGLGGYAVIEAAVGGFELGEEVLVDGLHVGCVLVLLVKVCA